LTALSISLGQAMTHLHRKLATYRDVAKRTHSASASQTLKNLP